jgi:hypothetical protein
MDRREIATQFIHYCAWSGIYERNEVWDYVDVVAFGSSGEDGVSDIVVIELDDEDESWLRAAIDEEFSRKREAERTWPEVTDCDRLDRAFETLQSRGLLTQHTAGMTQEDGLELAEALYEEAGGRESGIAGYCFYTLQDMKDAMEGTPGLWLAFGDFSGDGRRGEAVGRQVRAVMEEHGLHVSWDGSVKSRLLLSGFGWQRRSPSARP